MEQKGFVPLFPPPTTPSSRSILSPKTLQSSWKIQQWVYNKRGKRALSLTQILSHHLIGKEEESAQGAGEQPLPSPAASSQHLVVTACEFPQKSGQAAGTGTSPDPPCPAPPQPAQGPSPCARGLCSHSHSLDPVSSTAS